MMGVASPLNSLFLDGVEWESVASSIIFFPSVTGKLTKIPKRDFIFARVKTGQVGT